MARRRTSFKRKRTTKRRYSRRRKTTQRKSKRITRPCPPGFTRSRVTNRCRASRNRASLPKYTPTNATSTVYSKKTGAPIKLRTKYTSLSDALKKHYVEGGAKRHSRRRRSSGRRRH